VLLRYKCPQLFHVDSGVPLRIARQVEAAHTNLTKVTRMVFIKVGSDKHGILSASVWNKDRLRRTGGGVHHQQDHDHQGVSDASLHAHGPLIHVRDVCESSSNGSAFSTCLQVST
jgi:hypothetical protein